MPNYVKGTEYSLINISYYVLSVAEDEVKPKLYESNDINYM